MGPPGGPGTYVDSLAALRLLDPTLFAFGYIANVAGYAAPNDGGGGLFMYDPTSVAADNDGTIVEPANTIGRWYRQYSGALNVRWFGATGLGVVDDTTKIQSVIDFANTSYGVTAIAQVVFVPTGIYLIRKLIVRANIQLVGAGRFSTVFKGNIATVIAGDLMFTDNGVDAAKIIMSDFDIYAENCPYAAVIKLGYGSALNPQFGTEGYLRNRWIRECPNYALWIRGNVGILDTISIWTAGSVGGTALKLDGEANHASCIVMAGYKGCVIGDWTIHGLHLEGPTSGTVPLTIATEAKIFGLTMATPNTGTPTYSHLIEITGAPGDGYWLIHGLSAIISTGTIVTNGNFLDNDGRYFGGNATGGGASLDGTYSYKQMEVGGLAFVKRMERQSFTVRLFNDAGVIKHKIGSSPADSVTGNFCGKIIGATSGAYTVTPTGADGATAMAGGLKIGSAATNALWLDVAIGQAVADFVCSATIAYNSSTTALTVIPAVGSLDINGTVRIRPSLAFQNATSGANYNLTTLPVGAILDIRFDGYIY